MKILLVLDQFFDPNNGFTISARRYAKTLQDRGNQVRIVSAGHPSPEEKDMSYVMDKLTVPFFDGLITSQGMTFAKPDDDVLRKAISWSDVVHFVSPFALSHHGIMICRELGVPFTGAFHVQPENITSSINMNRAKAVNDGIYHWFHHYIYRYCEHIHCPSNFIAEELRQAGYTEKLHVISNGIDPDFIGHRPHPEQTDGTFNILSVGRYSVEKRQDVTIRAVARSKYRDRISLTLAGKGPKEKYLRDLAKSLSVPVKMEFLPKERLIQAISRCDLYVHAADMEIEAMSCMEAFACGRVPVIADSAKSATPQFALDERSLFTAGDSEDLAKKIDYWYENTQQRLEAEQNYALLGSKYDLRNCVAQAEEMFRQAIEDFNGQKTDNKKCTVPVAENETLTEAAEV